MEITNKEIVESIVKKLNGSGRMCTVTFAGNDKRGYRAEIKYRSDVDISIGFRKAGRNASIRISFALKVEDDSDYNKIADYIFPDRGNMEAVITEGPVVTYSNVLMFDEEDAEKMADELTEKAIGYMDIIDSNIDTILHEDVPADEPSLKQDKTEAPAEKSENKTEAPEPVSKTTESVSEIPDEGKRTDENENKKDEPREDEIPEKVIEDTSSDETPEAGNEVSEDDELDDDIENLMKEIENDMSEIEEVKVSENKKPEVNPESNKKDKTSGKKEAAHEEKPKKLEKRPFVQPQREKPGNRKKFEVSGKVYSGKKDAPEDIIPDNARTESDRKDENKPYDITGAPVSVRQQIEAAYDDISKVFAERTRQIEEREKNVNEYAERVKTKEKEADEKAKELEKEYLKKSIRLDDEMTRKKAELESEYEKMVAAAETSYIRKETELEDRINKAREDNEKKAKELEDRENEIFSQIKGLEFEKKKLKVQSDTIAAKEKNISERLAMTKNVGHSKEGSGSENVKILESKIKMLEATVDKERDIAEKLREVGGKKDNVINKNRELIKKLDKKIEALKLQLDRQQKDAAKMPKTPAKNNEADEAEVKKFKETEDKLNREISSLNDKIESLNDTVKYLKDDILKKETEIKENGDIINSQNERIAMLDTSLTEKCDENEKLNRELSESRKNPAPAAEKIPEKDMLGNRANKAIDELTKAGIPASIVPGEGFIVSGSKDSIEVSVDVKAEVMYFEKQVKKSVKHQKAIEELNKENIRTAYMIDTTDNKVICKCLYDDVMKSAVEVTGKLAVLD